MKKTMLVAISLISVSMFANASDSSKNADTKNAESVNLSAISSLLQDTSPFTEKEVIVEGRLIKQLSSDTYILADGKSEIQVELDDDIKLLEPIDPAQKLRLFGEYEGGSTPEIEVEFIQIL